MQIKEIVFAGAKVKDVSKLAIIQPDQYPVRFPGLIRIEQSFQSTELPAYVGETCVFDATSIRHSPNVILLYGQLHKNESTHNKDVEFALESAFMHHFTMPVAAANGAYIFCGKNGLKNDDEIETPYNASFEMTLGVHVILKDGSRGWVFEK